MRAQTFGVVISHGTVNGVDDCLMLEPANEDQIPVIMSPEEVQMIVEYIRIHDL